MKHNSLWVPVTAGLVALALASLLPSTPALGHRRKQAVTCEARCNITPPRQGEVAIPPGALANPPFQVAGIGSISIVGAAKGEPLAYEILEAVSADPGALVAVYRANEPTDGNTGDVFSRVFFRQSGTLEIDGVVGNPTGRAIQIAALSSTVNGNTVTDVRISTVAGTIGAGGIAIIVDRENEHFLGDCVEWAGTVRVGSILFTLRQDAAAQPAGTVLRGHADMRKVRCVLQ
jgi:hypothetical protein